MARPNPYRMPEIFRQVKFGGWLVPAKLVAINGVKIEEQWDVQRAIGMSGWSTIWRGTKPVENGEITLEAPEEEDYDALGELWDRLRPRNGQRPPTVKIENPIFNFIGVERISRRSWEGPIPLPSLSWQVKLGLIQYFPLVLAKVGPQEPAKLPGEPKPTDDGERILAQLSSKINGLL